MCDGSLPAPLHRLGARRIREQVKLRIGDRYAASNSRTGELIDRVDTGSRIANGMFLTAGLDRDVYYCSTLTLARVAWG